MNGTGQVQQKLPCGKRDKNYKPKTHSGRQPSWSITRVGGERTPKKGRLSKGGKKKKTCVKGVQIAVNRWGGGNKGKNFG